MTDSVVAMQTHIDGHHHGAVRLRRGSTSGARLSNADEALRERAKSNRLGFWADQARELVWSDDFSEVLDWSNRPFAKWFVGGTLNVSFNCVDRHVTAGHGDRVAIHWVGEPGDSRDITYSDLLCDVSKAANYFAGVGLRAGDRVAILMPLIPEAVVAMLACARLGLVHVFSSRGLSADAFRAQVDDAQPRVIITSDGQYCRGVPTPMKTIVDDALAAGVVSGHGVDMVVVVRRTGQDVESSWVEGRDRWWEDTIGASSGQHAAEPFDAEHPLFLHYDSGKPGRPEGIVQSSGGYLTQARYTFHYVFDSKTDSDVFWCCADLGSIAGYTYVVYGPLADGATSVIYEGAADFPDESRHFQIIERYGVTTYYVTSTLVGMFMKSGREIADAHDLSSLRLLGTMDQLSDPEAGRWYRDVMGGNRCQVVDTWGERETGAIMIAPLPGVTALKPGSPVDPLPGISAHIVDDDTNLVEPGQQGRLVLDRPWPAMPRGIWSDATRFVERFWSHFDGRDWYFTGVDARYDDEEAIWVGSGGDDVNGSGDHHDTSYRGLMSVRRPA